jgi:hypothetical protein
MPTNLTPLSDPTDRDLLDFLERELAPLLARERRSRLLAAVHRAVRSHDPRRLGSLPERSRRELLSIVEERFEHRRNAPSPGVVVRLVTAVSPAPPTEAGLGRLLATPAR